MELESDLAKELFNKVILPIQAKNIDSKKTYQNIPVKQDNKEQEKTQELEDLNKITQSKPVLLPEPPSPIPALPPPPAPALPVSVPALPAPAIEIPTLPALPPPAIKVNKEELLSENNIDNLLTILRKALSQKQDDNEVVISQSGDIHTVDPKNKTDDVVVSTLSSTAAPAPAPAPAPVVTSCDDEDCQELINTSQSQQVSPESQQDISLTPPDLSEEESIDSLTQKIPELNIGDKMSWISQALAALFSTIGTLFTFEPVQDNDPYVNEEKENQGYVYVGKMYMKPEDETKRPEKVKYINYNPTEKDFYIDEREEVK